MTFNRFDLRQRRRVRSDFVEEVFNRARFAFDINHDACRVVEDTATQCAVAGKREDVRTKAHALDDTAYHNLRPCRQISLQPPA